MSAIKKQKGLTLIEVLIVIFVITIVGAALYWFIVKGYQLQRKETAQIEAQLQARKAAEKMINEMREIKQSDAGNYPIATAESATFSFYANVDSVSDVEKVRYFIDGTNLKRGVIKPAGSPLQYAGAETVTTTTANLRNGGTPLFSYFDSSGNQLNAPVDITRIRLVKIQLVIDADTNSPPEPFNLQTEVTLRNLKDNL